MSLSSLVTALAARLADEFNTVRTELASGLSGKANTVHTHSASDITSGTLSIDRLPLVIDPAVSLPFSTSLTPDASVANYRECVLTGATTLNAPTNGTKDQRLLIRFTASSAQTITLSGLTKLDFIPDSVSVETEGYVGLMCTDTTNDTWVCISAGVVG